MMSWFEDLFGFEEESPEKVRKNLILKNTTLYSLVNHKEYDCGELEIVSLKELRLRINLDVFNGTLKIKEIVDDIKNVHLDKLNEGAFFQAASQFNLLEMVGPEITPEMGVSRYIYDKTQGPACAISCGAGTVFRNYFVPIKEQIGQNRNSQINCLSLLENEWDNEKAELWNIKNGYALCSQEGLLKINKILGQSDNEQRDIYKSLLQIGIQKCTQVTLSNATHKITQAYCSALPVAYSNIYSFYWESFARLILEASYEATLFAAIENYQITKNPNVYLTLLGGGAFGNENDWIIESIQLVLNKFKNTPLNIYFVSYGSKNSMLQSLLN